MTPCHIARVSNIIITRDSSYNTYISSLAYLLYNILNICQEILLYTIKVNVRNKAITNHIKYGICNHPANLSLLR